MAKSNMILIHERLTKLETTSVQQCVKIKEIHKALIGNGQVGLLAEWNQWKGGIKLFGQIIAIVMGILTFSVGALAYIR